MSDKLSIFRLRLKSSEGFSLFVKISEKAIPVKDDNFFFDFVRQLTELLKKNKRASDASLLTYQGNFQVKGVTVDFRVLDFNRVDLNLKLKCPC